MGYYINPPDCSKETWLRRNARKLPEQEARTFDFTSDELPVCWVDNGGFSAAGIAYDEHERDAFLHPDHRPKLWFAVKTALLYDVSNLPKAN